MAHLIPNLIQYFRDANGEPLAGGLLYSYAAGTSTPLATYTDASEVTANPNPIVLDGSGEAVVWLGSGTYKFVLKDSLGNTLRTIDDVTLIEDGIITTSKLANNSVTLAKMTDNSVGTAELIDLGVTTGKLASSAVTTAKIADSNVTTAKIADSNITTAKIADSNVTTAKIANANITTAKMADAAITSVKTAVMGIFTATPSPTTITSTTYVTIATGTMTKVGDGALVGVIHNSNIISVNAGYVRLQNVYTGVVSSDIDTAASLTLELNNGSFSTFFDNQIGFGITTNSAGNGQAYNIYPPGSFYFNLGNWQAGTYTFTLRAKVTSSAGTPTLLLNNVFFAVKETLERYI